MKKLILLTTISILLTNCYDKPEKSKTDKEKDFTTVFENRIVVHY